MNEDDIWLSWWSSIALNLYHRSYSLSNPQREFFHFCFSFCIICELILLLWLSLFTSTNPYYWMSDWPLIHEDMHQLVAHVTELVFQLSLIEMHPSLFLRFCLPISVSSCLTILSLVLIPSNTNFSKESSLFMWPKDHNRWCSHLDHHCGHSRSLWRHPPPSKPPAHA